MNILIFSFRANLVLGLYRILFPFSKELIAYQGKDSAIIKQNNVTRDGIITNLILLICRTKIIYKVKIIF